MRGVSPFKANRELAVEAGKKSRRGLGIRNQMLNDLFEPKKAKQVFLKMQQMAIEGDTEMIKLYMAYCFGRPKEVIDINAVIEAKKAPSWFVSPDHIMTTNGVQKES